MNKNKKTSVSAIKCTSYDINELTEALKDAVTQAGGFPVKLSSKSKVLLKPNLLTARPPEHAVTTHPAVVKAVIHILKEQGVTKISITDSPAGNYSWETLWDKTGMQQVADEENAELIPMDNIKRVTASNGVNVPIMKELEDFDMVISLPKLKTHILTKITAAVKNSYGLIPGPAKSMFHGQYQSPKKMGLFIADIFDLIKPDFVIMDAVVCMQGLGPANGTPFELGVIMAGSDAVAVDACACETYNYKATEIPLLKKASENGFGTIDPELIEKKGDAWDIIKSKKPRRSNSDFLHIIPEKIFHTLTLFLSFRPHINQKECVKCGVCKKVCSQDAIIIKNGKFIVQPSKCILCMCCMESCASHAVKLRTFWGRLFRK